MFPVDQKFPVSQLKHPFAVRQPWIIVSGKNGIRVQTHHFSHRIKIINIVIPNINFNSEPYRIYAFSGLDKVSCKYDFHSRMIELVAHTSRGMAGGMVAYDFAVCAKSYPVLIIKSVYPPAYGKGFSICEINGMLIAGQKAFAVFSRINPASASFKSGRIPGVRKITSSVRSFR